MSELSKKAENFPVHHYKTAISIDNENAPEGENLVSMNKKPENMDQLIVLYMEMRINHDIMSSRLDKIENRLNAVLTLALKVDNE